MGKSFCDLVRSSRSYRRFQEDEVLTKDDVAAFVNTARFAPTGNNTQLLRFHIADTPAEKAAIFSRLHWAALFKDWDGPAEGERPAAYVAICVPEAMVDNPRRCFDVGIAAQTIALAAASRGIGCCIQCSFDKDVDEVMGTASQGYATELMLALGVPGEKVVLERAESPDDLAYWRDEAGVHHVPKLSLEDVLI